MHSNIHCHAVEQEAVVLFDYDKEEDDDLTIKVGQVIKNVIQVKLKQ